MWPPETRPLLGGAAGEGRGAAGRGWHDAVPGKCCWLLVRKVKHSCLPGPPAPPMYACLGSGPVAVLPASAPPSTLGSWSSGGGGGGRVPQERKRPGGVRTSGRGANVWQVSEA